MTMDHRSLDIHDLYCTRDVYGFDLSPDGSQWLFIDQFGESVDEEEPEHGDRGDVIVNIQADLALIPADGGYPQPLGLSHLPLSPPKWSPDGRAFAFGGREGIWAVSLETGCAKSITTSPVCQLQMKETSTRIRQFSSDCLWADVLWSPDGQRLLYVTSNEGTQELWWVAADGSARARIHSLEGQIFSRQWSPDGREILFVAREWDGNIGAVWIVHVDGGAARQVTPVGDCIYVRPLAAWADGGEQIVLRANDTGYAKLWAMRPDGTEKRQITFGNHDESIFRIAPDGTTVAYASRAEQLGGEDIWITSLSDGTTMRLTEQPGLNRPIAWAPDGKTVYYFHTSPTEPGDMWSVKLDDPTPHRLTTSRYPWLSERLAWPEEVMVPGAGDGIYTLIYEPVDFDPNETYPAVLWIKGGPTTSARLAYDPSPHRLANEGYVVVSPNYRGSIGFGVDHMKNGALGQAGKTDLEDIITVTEYVKSLDYVKAERVAITGRSWGGYMTLMAVTRHPDTFRCAAAHAAIYNWEVQQAEEDVRYYSHWLYDGWANEKPDFFAERSPISKADQVKVPLLITHGKADKNVPFVQVQAFLDEAEKADINIETKFYESEGHGNKRPENRQDAWERTVQFLDRHLKPWDRHTNPKKGQRLE